jgi:thymidylate synthase (FAD)
MTRLGNSGAAPRGGGGDTAPAGEAAGDPIPAPAGSEPARSSKRPISPGLEEVLGRPFRVLDDGFIRVVDYLGNDDSIVQAARVSYGKGTKRVHEDRGLIRYLLRHRHTTPFEMCEIKLHVRVPMDCWRQWIRHRTASVNEYSTERGRELSRQEAELQRRSRAVYEERLAAGVAREQARKDLPLSTYTEAYWKIDLHNLLHFLALRMDAHAQLEIREYANVIGREILARWCPVTWEAFLDYRLNAASLTRPELEVVRALTAGEAEAATALVSKRGLLVPGKRGWKRNRELAELEEKLRLLGLRAPWRGGREER